MDKETLLQELSAKVKSGEISQEEVMSVISAVFPQIDNKKIGMLSRFSITKMLYVLGIVVAILGIFILFAQIWSDIGSLGRIAVTLGFGLYSAFMGSMLFRQKPESGLGSVFHIIGGMLIPTGALVTLSEFSLGYFSWWPITFAFGVIFASYLVLSLIHKKPVLTFFALVNGTFFVYLLVESMVGSITGYYKDLYAHLTMVVGSSYLFLAHSFRNDWNKKLFGIICFLGSAGFLGAGFWQVVNYVSWQFFYFLVVLGFLRLSVYMQSRSILVVSTIFLIIHISYITSEYFANSIGWPVSLVILGFIFIGLGYASLEINKKYIKEVA
ncbi:MAG: DUF2157 domain-containing protein [Patescibacteria group bacterium]|nr:DUF2157 domain-containing protein [Patescibacteria group bacterium]